MLLFAKRQKEYKMDLVKKMVKKRGRSSKLTNPIFAGLFLLYHSQEI